MAWPGVVLSTTVDNGSSARLTGRRVALALAIAAGLAFLSALVFLFTADLGRFRDNIVSMVTSATGREFRIAGELHIDVGRTVDIHAQDVTLADAPESLGEPMLQVGSLRMSVQTSSLLFGPLSIVDIDLRDAVVRITESEGGRSNWSLDTASPAERDSQRAVSPPLLIERLHAERVAVVVVSPRLEKPVAIAIATADHGVREDRIRSTLVGSINGETMEFESDLGPRSHIWQSRPVDFVIHGRLGAVTLGAEGKVDDLLSPERPVVNLTANGPSIEYLLDLLNLPALATGPLALSVRFEPRADRVMISADGTGGEYAIGVDGWVSDFHSLESLDLSFRALGPDIGRLGRLLGAPELPDDPFELSGGISREPGTLRLEDIELRIGSMQVGLSGDVHSLLPPDGERVALELTGGDIADYRELIGLPGEITGPFALQATLLQADDDIDRLRITGNVGEITHTATVFFDDSADLSGERVEFRVEGPDVGTIGTALDYPGLPALPFLAEGSAVYTGERIDIEASRLSIGNDEATIRGVVRPAFSETTADLEVSVAAANIGATLAAWGYDDVSPVPARGRMNVQVDGRVLSVPEFTAGIGNIDLAGALDTDLGAPASSTSIRMRMSSPDPAAFFGGSVSGTPARALDAAIRARAMQNGLQVDELAVAWGDSRLEAHGLVGRPPEIEATALDIRLTGPRLASLFPGPDPGAPDIPYALQGRLTGTREALTASDLRIDVGASRGTLDVTYRPAGSPEFDLRLESPYIDIRPFAPDREPVSAADEVAPGSETNAGRLIPDARVPVELLQRLTLRASVRVDELIAATGQYRAVQLDGMLAGGGLSIDHFGALGARGNVAGRLSYTPVDGVYELEADIDGERFILAQPGATQERIEAAPRFDIESRLTARGTSVYALLGSLDGLLIVSGSPGVLPTKTGWLANLVTGDFLYQLVTTVNPFVKQENQVRMDCAVVLVDAESGRLSGDPLVVMQTDRLNLFVKGEIDLTTEALDLLIRTQQRKGLGISIGEMLNPYTRVVGTLAAPRLAVDPKGTIVGGGAAALTGGLSMIAKGMGGRFLSEKRPCAAALKAFRESHESTAATGLEN